MNFKPKKNRILIAIGIALIAVSISNSCQRDDLCGEGSAITPRLIIKFIDNQTQNTIKQPTDLRVKAVEFDDLAQFEIDNTTPDSIIIPLRADALETRFELTINATSDVFSEINRDTIAIVYTPQEEYVSSACGFRVVFNGIQVSSTVVDSNRWIQDITEIQDNVTDEATAHVIIRH